MTMIERCGVVMNLKNFGAQNGSTEHLQSGVICDILNANIERPH